MKSLLVSQCLLGENVRYDGGNCSLSLSDLEDLKTSFHLIKVCPEVMAGMTIPREPIEIVNNRVVSSKGRDFTEDFESVFSYLDQIITQNAIKVALLKEKSPSCGVHSIYDGSFSGNTVSGMGIVTKFLREKGVEVFSEKEVKQLLEAASS